MATAVALVCLPTTARAQRGFMTGNELQSLCNTNDAWGMVACTAYGWRFLRSCIATPSTAGAHASPQA